MMRGMRVTALPALVVICTLATFAGGCAHTLESAREDRVVVAVDTKGADPVTAITEPPAVLVAEPVAVRPRLSRTVTLGEGTVEPIYAVPAQAQAAGGPNVVVNNNITVVGGPTGYGGYGGYGYSRSTGRSSGGTGGRADGSARSNDATTPTQPWAPSGWEGAGRTAAPGQTPHVGGNWAPSPSHGPRQLK